LSMLLNSLDGGALGPDNEPDYPIGYAYLHSGLPGGISH
jgi:hypothetical protein